MAADLPPITRALIFANVGVYLLQILVGDALLYRFALWPWWATLFGGWQLLSYGFLHASFSHLFFNMFGLYMFGPEVERVLGARRFLLYFLGSVVGAALLHLVVTGMVRGAVVPTVGASGGLFGLLLAFGMFFPHRRIMLLLPPIPMKAWVFVTLYGLAELLMGIFGTLQGVAHFAHLGGMLAGFLMLRLWGQPPRDRPVAW